MACRQDEERNGRRKYLNETYNHEKSDRAISVDFILRDCLSVFMDRRPATDP